MRSTPGTWLNLSRSAAGSGCLYLPAFGSTGKYWPVGGQRLAEPLVDPDVTHRLSLGLQGVRLRICGGCIQVRDITNRVLVAIAAENRVAAEDR